MIFKGRGRPQGNIVDTEIRWFSTNHDFSRSRPPAGQHSRKGNSLISRKSRFFKVEAARRATSTKRTFVYFQKKHDFSRSRPPAGQHQQNGPSFIFKKNTIFQGRGRPQGNINKTDNRLFSKNHDFLRSRPPAGQHQQNWQSFIVKNTSSTLNYIENKASVIKNRLPDHVLGWFWYQSTLKNLTSSTGPSESHENLQIDLKLTPTTGKKIWPGGKKSGREKNWTGKFEITGKIRQPGPGSGTGSGFLASGQDRVTRPTDLEK